MIKEEQYCLSESGSTIRIVTWRPQKEPKAVLVVTHGYAGHIDRYDLLTHSITQQDIACVGLDLTGHGKSSGKRAYVASFDKYVMDVETCYQQAVHSFPDRPVFLFGHSMGALITTILMIKKQRPTNGVILSGIALFVTDSVPNILVKLSGMASKWFPTLPTTKLKSQLTSSVDESVKRYESDPLIYHGGIRARTGYELMMAGDWAKAHIGQFKAPVLLVHGREDGLANVKGSIFFNDHAGSEDKTLKILDHGYHEVLNDAKTPEVLGLINAWIQARL